MDAENKGKLPPLESGEALIMERTRRRRRAWRIATLALVVGLGGACWYYYPGLQKHRGLLSRLPGVEQALTATGQRLDAAEEKLRTWASDREGLNERLSGLENSLEEGLQRARKQTREAIEQVSRRTQNELNKHTQVMDARLGRLESAQESERARLATVQQEIAAVREQVRQEMAEQLSLARQEAGRGLAGLDERLVRLDQQVDRGRQDLDGVARRVERRRIDFEVTKNRSRELAPGISMRITRTSTAYRRVDGWLWLLPDRRTVWIRNQGAQQSLVFYSKQDSRPYELVVTHVSRDGAVGYLLAPGRPLADTAQNAAPAVSTPSE